MKLILLVLIAFCVFEGCASSAKAPAGIPPYTPGSQLLHDSIVRMDSIWDDSYNNCKLDIQETIIADDLEFYHDRSGLMTSKKQLIEALKNNICGRVRRDLLKGSIEVYQLNNYGAVEMGYHRFISKGEQAPSRYSRFIHIWKKTGERWEITRVISLH